MRSPWLKCFCLLCGGFSAFAIADAETGVRAEWRQWKNPQGEAYQCREQRIEAELNPDEVMRIGKNDEGPWVYVKPVGKVRRLASELPSGGHQKKVLERQRLTDFLRHYPIVMWRAPEGGYYECHNLAVIDPIEDQDCK